MQSNEQQQLQQQQEQQQPQQRQLMKHGSDLAPSPRTDAIVDELLGGVVSDNLSIGDSRPQSAAQTDNDLQKQQAAYDAGLYDSCCSSLCQMHLADPMLSCINMACRYDDHQQD